MLTDIVMPDAGGFELAVWARAVRPEARILYLSGSFGNEGPSAELERPDVIFLAKPFRVRDLQTALRRALVRRPLATTANART